MTLRAGEAGAPPILDRVSALFPAGSVTAVVGPSGAGKSMLCDIVAGLLVPDEGAVRLDGRPLSPERLPPLRAALAYVGQEPLLFDDTLRANLSWGVGPVADEALWAAFEVVGAAELARSLGRGLESRLLAQGARLSGGERQRIRLAWAILRRPRLLILDEATTGLDAAAERAVLAGVLAACRGATVLVVSHRPTALALAERVLVLEGGRVIEAGAKPPEGHAAAPAPPAAGALAAERRAPLQPPGGGARKG